MEIKESRKSKYQGIKIFTRIKSKRNVNERKKQLAIDEAIIFPSIIGICISMTFNLYSQLRRVMEIDRKREMY